LNKFLKWGKFGMAKLLIYAAAAFWVFIFDFKACYEMLFAAAGKF
jgi:hypothetical protein